MHDLPIFNTLETMAEVGVALFAISGIVSVFGRGKALPWMIQDRVWLGGLLNWSFILILAGFTPSIMREIFSDIESVWLASHAIFFFVHVLSFCWFSYAFFFLAGASSFRKLERIIVVPCYVIAVFLLSSQVYVSLTRSPYMEAVYIITAGWFIYLSCAAFAFMLFPRTHENS